MGQERKAVSFGVDITQSGMALIAAAKLGMIPEKDGMYDIEFAKRFLEELNLPIRCKSKHIMLAIASGAIRPKIENSKNFPENERDHRPKSSTNKTVKHLKQALISFFFGCLGGLLTLILKFC